MKVGAVSGDLVVKLALVAGVAGLAWFLYRRAAGKLESVAGAVTEIGAAAAEVADAVIVGINPVNPDNLVNRAVSSVGSAVVSDTGPGRNADGSWTVGGWLYDVTHPDPVYASGTSSGSRQVFNPQSEEIVAQNTGGIGYTGTW